MKKVIQSITEKRFGPKDNLGWPNMIDDVIEMTTEEAERTSPAHSELKKLVNCMNESEFIRYILNQRKGRG